MRGRIEPGIVARVVLQRGGIVRNTMLSLLSGLLALAAPGALAQAAVTPDGHFDWPLGLDEPSGLQRMGYGYSVMQKFHNENGPFPTQPHSGVDLTQSNGVGLTEDDPVYASADGVVACTNDNQYDARRSYPGKVVVIRHRLPDGTTVYTQYGHLNFCAAGPQACAQPGDTLRRGQQIGTVVYQDYKDKDGNTINNTHLHFEVCDFDSTRP